MSSDGPRVNRVLLGGGIGAGKSSVAGLFVEAGFDVIEADRVGAEVLGPGSEATEAVADQWPGVVSNGAVNREALARIVFSSNEALRRLEAITHPAIRSEIEDRVSASNRSIVVEVPLTTLELEGHWNRVAVVADENIRVARAVARGGDPDDVSRRVSAQVLEGDWLEWADFVVDNGGSWSETQRSVDAVIEELTT